MARLLDVATVHTGDGHWSANLDQVLAPSCGVTVSLSDVCTPEATVVAGDATDDYDSFERKTFVIIADLARRIRCSDADGSKFVNDAIKDTQDRTVGRALWSSVTGAGMDMYFTHASVRTVAAGANASASLAAALQSYYDNGSGPDPVIHLGLTAAVNLSSVLVKDGVLDHLQYVVNPGYPTAGIAVSGPVTVYLGSIETIENVDLTQNRTAVQANQLAAVEFDPCLAVRVS